MRRKQKYNLETKWLSVIYLFVLALSLFSVAAFANDKSSNDKGANPGANPGANQPPVQSRTHSQQPQSQTNSQAKAQDKTTPKNSRGSPLVCKLMFQLEGSLVTKLNVPSHGELEADLGVEYNKWSVRFNGISVTGEEHHPLDLVMKDLSLSDEWLRVHAGQTVVSLGEGTSGLVPHLLNRGLDAYGIDIWYDAVSKISDLAPMFPHSIGKLYQYSSHHTTRLIEGSASDIPLKDNSVDVIVSHMLINNLGSSFQKNRMLAEIVRVLKPGGEARIYGILPSDFTTMFQLQRLSDLKKVSLSFEMHKFYEFADDVDGLGVDLYLYKLHKT
jgi:SAM-dependent methyltransferase